MTETFAIHPEPVLRQFTHEFLSGLGASSEEAATITDGLMTASLWWHPGQRQGLEKLVRYYRRVRNGGLVPGAEMEWVRERASSALLDARKGFGYVAAQRAMHHAMDKAKSTGVAMVGVCNSNHFGIAGYHARTAAQAGLIGWSMTNAGAEMAPTGSATAVLGTNPWGIAIPRRDQPPIVLDMALTTAGKGMMRYLDRQGDEMPLDWALTPDGARTAIPGAALAGALLPMGENKGYGLSLVTDMLAGVMTGALFGLDVFQEDTHFDVGHQMLAISPDAFIERDLFDSRVEALVDQVKSAPPIDPSQPVLLPGERELARAAERLERGVPVERETLEELRPLAAALEVAFPFDDDRSPRDSVLDG